MNTIDRSELVSITGGAEPWSAGPGGVDAPGSDLRQFTDWVCKDYRGIPNAVVSAMPDGFDHKGKFTTGIHSDAIPRCSEIMKNGFLHRGWITDDKVPR